MEEPGSQRAATRRAARIAPPLLVLASLSCAVRGTSAFSGGGMRQPLQAARKWVPCAASPTPPLGHGRRIPGACGRGGGGPVCMSDWMFVSAKDQGRDVTGFDMAVLTPTFGRCIVPGEERAVEVSRSEDEMLVRKAAEAGEDIGYVVGRASLSRSTPNSQEFLGGSVVTRLRVGGISAGGGRGFSFQATGAGRVRVRYVKKMRPYVEAEVEEVSDSGVTEEQWKNLERVQGTLCDVFDECRALYQSISEKTLSSRLDAMKGQEWLLGISMEDQVELMGKRDRGGAGGQADVPVKGVPDASRLFGGAGLEEMVEGAAGGGLGGAAKREILSFLACRAAGVEEEEMRGVLEGVSSMDRSLVALERLEHQRDKLRVAQALSGLS